eukprot:jgi/Picre1/33808/NNA_001287.t1
MSRKSITPGDVLDFIINNNYESRDILRNLQGLLLLSEEHDLVKDVKNLLCDPARVEIFRIKGSNKYFRGLQYAKHKQRNMGKTLLACLLRFRDQTKTMEIVCKQVEDAICGILQLSSSPLPRTCPQGQNQFGDSAPQQGLDI